MQMSSPPAPQGSSRAKAIAFRLAAVALPIAVVLLLEAVLRLAGVEEVRRKPFQPVPGRADHTALSPDYGGMFFRGFRPGVAFDPFAAEKAPGTLRIFALGGSTTAAFPYHWYYGFPARLEDRLAAASPGRRIEVANLGMTATNSFTIRDLAPAVAAQQPDAVVIYAGHNEFYGAYGTASTQGWAGTSVLLKRLLIGASKWALVAGIGQLLEGDGPAAGERRTMMARVVRESSIAADSDAYRAGVAQFESNLRSALHRFERAGIPVYLGTLTSNLAGQPPLGDEPAAQAAYELGRRRLAAGDSATAREAFLLAKEADGLRFRAPEDVNAAIRRLAVEFPNVVLVDVQDRFRVESPGGVEGAALFADHLHPNARGYAVLADAYAEVMRSTLPALDRSMAYGPAPSDIDPIEMRYADMQIAILTSGYPFRKDRTPAQAEAAARAKADSMAQSNYYADQLAAKLILDGLPMAKVLHEAVQSARENADTLSALRLYGALLHWQPFNDALMERAVGFAVANPAYDAETAALARYAAIHSGSAFSLNALAAVALRRGDLDHAEALLEEVEHLDQRSPEMLFNRARLLVMQGDTAAARAYFERYRAVAPQ